MKKVAKWIVIILPWFGMLFFGYHLFMKELEDAVGEKSSNAPKMLLQKNKRLKEYIKVRSNFSTDKEALNEVSKIRSIQDSKCPEWNHTILGFVSFDEAGQIEKSCDSVIINCECFEAPKVTTNEKL